MGLFFLSRVPFLTESPLMSCKPEEEQLVFNAASEQYREMGLICVPLTERKRVKRHTETIEGLIVGEEMGGGRPVQRQNQQSIISLYVFCHSGKTLH